MKKVLSILLCATLIVGLVSVFSLAETTQRSAPLFKTLADGATETELHDADANGGVKITQNNGWKPWVAYYTDEAMELTPEAGEDLYLVFDMTVPEGSQIQFDLNEWKNSISGDIAGAQAGTGEGGVKLILGGTYKGAFKLDKSLIGKNGRVGILGTGITIRTLLLVCSTETPDIPNVEEDPTESVVGPSTPDPVNYGTLSESSSVDIIDTITNGTNEDDPTEITDSGSGFSISQASGWNVWVLNYAEEVASFEAAEGEDLYLVYDLTVNGDGHLCINEWNSSVAASIAAVAGAATSRAEDGTPMLKAGSYQGFIPVTKDMVGKNGRLGIVGTGATIREFRLVSGTVDGSEVSQTTSQESTEPSSSEQESQDPVPPISGDRVPLLKVVVDAATETEQNPADGKGGVSLSQSGGWKSWVTYYTNEAMAIVENGNGPFTIYYDMDVPSGSEVQIALKAWDGAISKDIAGSKAGTGEGGVSIIPGGTYTGSVTVDKAMIGEFGHIGIVGTGITVREFSIEGQGGSTSQESTEPQPSEQPTEPTPSGEEVALIKTVVDGATETESYDADSKGGVTLSQSGGWKAWVSYYTDAAMELIAGSTEPITLKYDFTVPSGSEVQLTLNGWDGAISKDIAGSKAGTGEGGVSVILGGTYTGTLTLDKSAFGENGRIGIVGSGITIREFALVAPGSDVTSQTSNPEDVFKGDVTGDDSIDMKDVLMLRKYIAQMDADIVAANSDVNSDGNIDMKDVLMIRKYIAHIITSFDEDESSETESGSETIPGTDPTTTRTPIEVSGDELVLIDRITNGTADDEAGTEIYDNGSGFSISQANGWNVWVLYFNEALPDFINAKGKDLTLVYDFTLNGDGHLCAKEWTNSLAAAIAENEDVITTPAEDGTPMLMLGTHSGQMPIDASLFGENGRLGIVGTGATIRTFKLVAGGSSAPTSSKTTTSSKPTTPTQPGETKPMPTTKTNTPYLNIQTDAKNGSLGMWWWNANKITSANVYNPILDDLQLNHVTEIYVCIGNQSYDQIGTFIEECGSRGIRVAWLSGDTSWVDNGNTGFDSMFSHFKAYQNQAKANQKFYGIHLDVEPYTAGKSWQNYANLVVRATKAAHDYGTIIEWDIPFWLDDNNVRVTANGQTVSLLELLADTSDTLVLMSYRDTANGVLTVSNTELGLTKDHNCRVVCGFETNYTADGPQLSFAEDGKIAMVGVVESVFNTLKARTDLTAGWGIAIHHVDTWLTLQN